MTLTDDLKNQIARSTQTAVDNNFTHGAVGTGTSNEDETDSGLDTEVLRKQRANFTETSVSGGNASATISLFLNSFQGNGNTLTEFGFFDDATAGTMQSRDLFPGIEKNDGIELFIELTVNISVTENT